MLVHRILLLLFMLTGGNALIAQSTPLSATSVVYAGKPIANVELPDWVKAPERELTLYAGFDYPDNRGLPLYSVNRTGRPVTLGTEDGDAAIKLERQLPSGEWERVQGHCYSDCGNSYGSRTLPPGMHFKMPGYHCEKGTHARLRYSGYGDLRITSNVGEGFYDEAEAAFARGDQMALHDVPFELTWKWDSMVPRWDGKVSRGLAALHLTEELGEVPGIRAGVEKWLEELQSVKDPSAAQRQAIPLIQASLKRDWGKSQGWQPALTRCLAALKTEAGSFNLYGSPEAEPALVWEVVGAFAQLETSGCKLRPGWTKPSRAFWLGLMDIAVAKASTLEDTENNGAFRLLAVKTLADELVSDAVFEHFMETERSDLVPFAAYVLARRGRFEKLVKLGSKLSPQLQIQVLKALVLGSGYNGQAGFGSMTEPRDEPDGEAEAAFWQRVVKASPVQVASALSSMNGNPFRRHLFSPVLHYWRNEAARSARLTHDFELGMEARDREYSVKFIGAWYDKEDVPLLQSLLSYRGYEYRQTISTSPDSPGKETVHEMHVFSVRTAAADALKKLGESVPKDIVFEAEVPATQQETQN